MDWVADHAGMLGLLFFFVVFVCIAVWAYLPGNKKEIEQNKYIPLSEEENGK